MVDPKTGCWNWTLSTNTHGYGQHCVRGKNHRAHRTSYVAFNGAIPDGAHVLHKCDNLICCNPEHLFLGDQQSNMADMVRKGRGAKGEQQGCAKLTVAKVQRIRLLYDTGDYSQSVLGDMFGVSQFAVHKVVRNKTWMHLPKEGD